MAAADGPISAHAATPNPFIGSTRITFDLPQASRVGAEIFDAQGRRVRVLEDRALDAGRWALDWDGRDAGGVASPPGSTSTGCAWKAGTRSRARWCEPTEAPARADTH